MMRQFVHSVFLLSLLSEVRFSRTRDAPMCSRRTPGLGRRRRRKFDVGYRRQTGARSRRCVAAEPHRIRRVFSTLALAFAADPASRWLFPEPESYLQHFPAFARALAGPSLQRRTALATADYGAVALWLAPGDGPDEDAMADLIDEEVRPDKKDDVAAVIEQMGRYHPLEPHWYLPFIGVEPSRQGHGLGGALLRSSLPASMPTDCPPTWSRPTRETARSTSVTASTLSARSGSAAARPSSRCSAPREAEPRRNQPMLILLGVRN